MSEQPGSAVTTGAFNPDDEQMIRYLGLDPRKPADRAAVAVAQHYGLDPMLKHVVVIPGGGVYITRDGLLHIAHRSGQLDGIVVEQDPTLVDDEWVCRVTVYRRDMRHGFTFPGRYPAKGGNKAYPQEMAMKAAEAHALRRAFDINGLPAYDERREQPAREPAQRVDWRAKVAEQQQRTPDVVPPPQAQRIVASSPEPDVPVEIPGQQALDIDEPETKPQALEPEQPEPAADPLPDPASSKQLATLRAQYRAVAITDRPAQLAFAGRIIGREISSHQELTREEADALLAELRTMVEAQQIDEELDDGDGS